MWVIVTSWGAAMFVALALMMVIAMPTVAWAPLGLVAASVGIALALIARKRAKLKQAFGGTTLALVAFLTGIGLALYAASWSVAFAVSLGPMSLN